MIKDLLNLPEDPFYAVKFTFAELMYKRWDHLTLGNVFDDGFGPHNIHFIPMTGDVIDMSDLNTVAETFDQMKTFGTTQFVIVKRIWKPDEEEGSIIELVVFPDGTYDADSKDFFYKGILANIHDDMNTDGD